MMTNQERYSQQSIGWKILNWVAAVVVGVLFVFGMFI
jgi:hypothetical protein